MGFGPKDRVLVIHVDDVGMCDTTVSSYAELADFGIVSSGSIMVPCKGFKKVVQWASNNPEVDVGVHLTLTSQWGTLRWAPVHAKDPEFGLVDGEGFFHKTRDTLWQQGMAEHIHLEMKKQVEMAINSGINISHIDAHMFAAMAPHIFPHYLALGQEFNKTVYINREGWQNTDQDGLNLKHIEEAQKQNLPIFDKMILNPIDSSVEELIKFIKHTINALPPGLSNFIIHPAQGTPEMQEITTDWRKLHYEYEAFLNPELRRYIQDSGVQIVSFRNINEAL